MEALLPIITQLIAGAAGGNAAGAVLKQQAVSVIVRTIVGAIGGLGGGFLIQMLGGEAAATGLVTQAIGAAIGGGALTGLAGLVLGKK
ncbi:MULTISPECIES: hypothetical protein [unclassified Rhizobium]|uniref:hypothetical protein n=1 Tax=unclassified Rhizobium TaxID=2613769 RepID=UPI000715DF64|nr:MULTISPECIES: hypothetical protein [unclassified Rhizobium]KQS99109.1 hypothetical protein ASG50_20615 [Rhizobium sp. Leaf386]KQT05417.1 hypothetical protein ASG42_21090 [Rhizobium sp. Leaf391]KQT91859.1 hypothetical protein ASG68_18740 [Rhizobium sp. Leaf453]